MPDIASTGGRLVVRPHPKDGESCSGYLIRITEANRYPSLAYVLEDADGNTGGFTKAGKQQRARQQWRALERHLGLREGEFLRRWPRQVATAHHLEPAPIGLLELVRADHVPGITHICPDCVAEDGYCRALWELRYYTVCHRHRKLMVSHCGACGVHLSVQRPAILRCGSCGSNLRTESKPIPALPESWAISGVLANAVAAAGISHREFADSGFYWLLLDDPSIVVAAIRAMGWLTQRRFARWLTSHQHSEVRHQQLCAVLSLFKKWPEVWWESLDRLVSERARNGRDETVTKALQRHRDMLMIESPHLRFLQRDFIEWVTKRWPTVWRSQSFAPAFRKWKYADHDRLFSSSEAARCLGGGTPAIRQMIREGRLTAILDKTGRTNRVLVTQESVYRVRASEVRLNWLQARKILKADGHLIGNPSFRSLLKVEKRGPRGALLIPRTRIEWLFDQIEAARTEVFATEDLVNMRSAVVICRPAGSDYAAILAWILEGSLPVCSFDRKMGLRSLQFRREDLRRLLMGKALIGHLPRERSSAQVQHLNG